MTRPPFTPAMRCPAYRALYMYVFATTSIDAFVLGTWTHTHWSWLQDDIYQNPDLFSEHRDVADQVHALICFEYLRRAREIKTQDLPPAPAPKQGGELSRRTEPGPVGSRFAGFFRRDQHLAKRNLP